MIQVVQRASALKGTVALPGDKSISHRYAMLAAVSEGTSSLRRFASSQDCRSTLRCLSALGVPIGIEGDRVIVEGRALRGLSASTRQLDAGNSGSTIRMLSGILAGHPFESSIGGDDSLSRRPMRRIMHPLRLMGATVEARDGEWPPLTIRGGRLRAVRYELPVASAQVKTCMLFAGLYSDGPTSIREATPTRDHTEIALRQFGARVTQNGEWIAVDPAPRLRAQELEVPADISSAAFFIVAALMVPGSDLFLPGIGLNSRRRELLTYLESAGAALSVENEYEVAGEPRGDLHVRYSPALREATLPALRGGVAAALIDEIPILSVLGSQVAGGLEIRDAGELRVKESDRLSVLAANLNAMGVRVTELPDGLLIAGGQVLRGAEIQTHGDHRIAMAFAIAGLVADGDSKIQQAECADVSFPGFFEILRNVLS